MNKIRLKSFFYEPPNLSLSLLIIALVCYWSCLPYLTLAHSLGDDSQVQRSAPHINVTLTKCAVAPKAGVFLSANRTLVLKEVQRKDAGVYNCEAEQVHVDHKCASVELEVLEPAGENTAPSTESPNAPSYSVPGRQKLSVNTKLVIADTNDKPSEPAEAESVPRFKKTERLVHTLHKPAGATISLLCPAHGNPMPNITWTRSAGDKNFTEIMGHIGKVTYKKWSMQMDDVIAEDSGHYKCTVCNKLGCIEHITKLRIMDRLRSRPIHSDKFPQNETVLTNSSAYFECRVVSELEPHIFWITYKRANESIDKLERLVVSTIWKPPTAKDFIKLYGDPDKPNVLRLQNVTHADEGWYTCVAANNLGESMASAYLHVVDKLPSREFHTVESGGTSNRQTVAIMTILHVLFFL